MIFLCCLNVNRPLNIAAKCFDCEGFDDRIESAHTVHSHEACNNMKKLLRKYQKMIFLMY